MDQFAFNNIRHRKSVPTELTLLHYTLTTGDTRRSPRSEVANPVLEKLTPMLRTGRHPLPVAGYECLTTIEGDVLLATVLNEDRPLVTFGVAPNDTAASLVWESLVRLYRNTPFHRHVPRQPAATPWCAAIVMAMLPHENWVADFERCLAWAWIETMNRGHSQDER